MTEQKKEALQDILDIAHRHGIGVQDIVSAFEETHATGPLRSRGVLSRMFNYLGGIFVFAGLSIYIGMNWESFNTAARLIVTLGPGITAYILGVLAVRDPRYIAAATPLFLIGAVLQATGMLVAFAEFSSGGDWRYAVLVTNATLLAQQGLGFWRLQRTALLFVTLVFGFGLIWVALDIMGLDQDLIALISGVSMLSLCIGMGKTPHRAVTPFWYFVAAACALYGMFEILQDSIVELLYLGVASGMVYLSTLARSRSLLVVSTVAIIGYLGYFTREHFLESAGWPVALIVFGFIMIFFGALALRLDKKFIRA